MSSVDIDGCHLFRVHLLTTLPPGDADFSARVKHLKSTFTRSYLQARGVEQLRSDSRLRQRARHIPQRRFWENTIRD